MKSVLSLTLSLLLILSLLTACGSPPETETQTETETESESEETVMNAYQETTYTMKDAEGLYKPLGRTDLLGSILTCDFPASGAEFKMDCRGKVTFSFTAAKTEQILSIYIDGVFSHEIELLKGIHTYTAAETLEEGIHTIRIVAQYSYTQNSLNKITLEGTLLPPEEKDVYIEFIGASSIGGAYLSSSNGNDATKSISYTAIQLLDVDYNLFSQGGMGIAFAGSPSHTVNNRYPYQSNGRSKDPYVPDRTPDLIVFNLGQNDNYQWYKQAQNNINHETFNYANFDKEVETFIKTLDSLYGEKKIPLLFVSGITTQKSRSLGTTRLEELIKTVYVPAGYDILICPVTTNRDGIEGHSSPAGAKKQGEELAAFIKANYPWLFE